MLSAIIFYTLSFLALLTKNN